MLEHSTDFWMGFGSFVDKPVSPFINVHPSKISNPCRYHSLHVHTCTAIASKLLSTDLFKHNCRSVCPRKMNLQIGGNELICHMESNPIKSHFSTSSPLTRVPHSTTSLSLPVFQRRCWSVGCGNSFMGMTFAARPTGHAGLQTVT